MYLKFILWDIRHGCWFMRIVAILTMLIAILTMIIAIWMITAWRHTTMVVFETMVLWSCSLFALGVGGVIHAVRSYYHISILCRSPDLTTYRLIKRVGNRRRPMFDWLRQQQHPIVNNKE